MVDMYIARIPVRRASGKVKYFYVLRHTYWSREEKRPIQKYLAYLGVQPRLTAAKARAIARKLGISVDDLKAVRGLRIEGDD